MERIGKHKCETETDGETGGEIEVERKMDRERQWKEERERGSRKRREATEQIAESCTATSCLGKRE